MENTILITGANNGIGFHMTQSLLAAGDRVGAVDLCDDNLIPLQSTYPDRLMVFPCDVTDPVQIQAAVTTLLERWGQVDVLVNNACLLYYQSFEDKPVADTRREFEVNYFGCLNTIAAVLPYMKARGKGIIHNLSSGVGITGFPGISGYASTKGAIESLTRTLALEFEKYGIVVNLMHPPLTNTKSAAPLGIPVQVMDDPARVGRSLAKQILSTKPIISTDLRSAIFLFISYRYPRMIGKLFARITADSTK